MSFLTEWLTSIVLFILFAIVIDMLLPNSSMQKYAKMVVSLLLIVVMLNPIFKLFKTDPEVIFEYLTENGQSQSADIKNHINSEKKEIQATQRAYILEEMAVQLKKKAEETFSHDAYKIEKLNVSAGAKVDSEEDITEISVHMAPASEKTVQTIAPIHINTDKTYESADTAEKKKQKKSKKSYRKYGKSAVRKLRFIWKAGRETAMNKNGLWHVLKKQLLPGQAKDGEKPKLTKYHYFLFVFVLGVSFMLVSQLFSSPEKAGKDTAETASATTSADPAGSDAKTAAVFKTSKADEPKNSIDDYEKEYENQLKEILETIIGVEDVSVVVNVDSTSLKVFEKNKSSKNTTTEETDKEGGKRSVTDQTSEEEIVMIRNGDQETPVVVQTKKPDIRGVLVVAQGVDNVQIKKPSLKQ